MKSEKAQVLGPKAVQCIFPWLRIKQNPPSSKPMLDTSSSDKIFLASVAAVVFLPSGSQLY